jgi:lipopolysaccharide export system protein LptA
LVGLLFASDAADAQELSFSSNDPNNPITVTAEQGLEWQQNAQRFIARGNAKAVQGDVQVIANELIAHYRTKTKGESETSEVYRVDAVGDVTIRSRDETAQGVAAVYDFDKGVLVMQGDPVTLTTADGVVTARRSIQYWSNDNVAVAEGDATAIDADQAAPRRITADKLTAYFRPKDAARDASNRSRDLVFLQGAGNVVLTTRNETVRGQTANYNLDTGIATVEGGVKMTRDKNQLNGGYAVVNVKSGVSRLYGSAAEAKGSGVAPPARVRALLAPNKEQPAAPAAPKGP